MKFFWDYYWLGGDDHYKALCVKTKNNVYELFRLKVRCKANEYL